MSPKTRRSKKKIILLNSGFVFLSALLLLFLFNAPEETTSFLPKDDIHSEFHNIKSKKEAEKSCLDCHDTGMEASLPEDHPPKYRCLFCHKRT